MQIIIELKENEADSGFVAEKNPLCFVWYDQEGWGHRNYMKDKSFIRKFHFREKVLFWMLGFLWDTLYKLDI